MPRQTLGGIEIPGHQDVRWALTEGVYPYQTTLEFRPADAAALLDLYTSRQEVGLELVLGGEIFGGVRLLGGAPPSAPFFTAVVLSDRRWRWSRQLVVRSYNVRRRSGLRRLIRGQVVAINQLVDDVTFARWSLDGRAAWRAVDVLFDVLAAVDPGAALVNDLGQRPREQTVDTLEIDDPGPEAVARALGYVSGVGVALSRDGGAIRVFNRLSGDERDAHALGPRVAGAPLSAEVSLAVSRPAAVEVFFDREIELRFDFDTTGTQTTRGRGDEPRVLENVLPSPDLELTLASGARVPQGTLITFEEAIAAWTADTASPPPEGFPLSDRLIRESWFNGILELLYGGALDGELDVVWARRVGAVRQHYRQTFRIPARWMEKIRSLRAYRVGLVDAETGTPALAQAFCDVLVVPSLRGYRKTFAGGAAEGFAGNVLTMGSAGAAIALASARPAPALVAVQDEHLGIVRVDFVLDALGVAVQVAPSAADDLPSANPAADRYLLEQAKLRATHRLALVLTAVQGAPNGLGRLHRETIRPADVVPELQRAVEPALGPVWRVRVLPGTATAWFPWTDGAEGAVEAAFGVGVGGGSPVDRPADLGEPLNREQLRDLALAVATQVYAERLDRIEGAVVTAFVPGAEPVGRVAQVEHILARSGALLTTQTVPAQPPPLNLFALLPASVRRLFFREVQP